MIPQPGLAAWLWSQLFMDGWNAYRRQPAGKAKQGIGFRRRFRPAATEGAAQEIKGNAQKAAGDAKDAIKKAVNKVADAANKSL